MIRWIELATAHAPGGRALRLMRRGDEFSIMLGGDELMNSRRGGSETALGAVACARLAETPVPHVLIGGLGMGFTLRAALGALGAQAQVTVAELVPEVVRWARGPLAEVFASCLDDPRVRLVEGDVTALIAGGAWDAILLDVDNGPDGLVSATNDRLYDDRGLGDARRTLRPGGVLAIWSAARDATFSRRLANAGFAVDEVTARSGGARHRIWIATTPSS